MPGLCSSKLWTNRAKRRRTRTPWARQPQCHGPAQLHFSKSPSARIMICWAPWEKLECFRHPWNKFRIPSTHSTSSMLWMMKSRHFWEKPSLPSSPTTSCRKAIADSRGSNWGRNLPLKRWTTLSKWCKPMLLALGLEPTKAKMTILWSNRSESRERTKRRRSKWLSLSLTKRYSLKS